MGFFDKVKALVTKEQPAVEAKQKCIYYGPPGKHGEFKTLASMIEDYAVHHQELTDEEKEAKLKAFWHRWGELVDIEGIRKEQKK